jgi:hypothetical protein
MDAESLRLFGRGEYFIWLGFSTIQQYLQQAYSQLDVAKGDALECGEKYLATISHVKVISEGANYWKHKEEWGLLTNVKKDITFLSRIATKTIRNIEKVTPWDDYTCSNLLAELTIGKPFQLISLLPFLIAWRKKLNSKHSTTKT